MRIWLQTLKDDELRKLKGSVEKRGPLYGVEIFCEGEHDYVEISGNPWQPSFRDLGIPQENIDRVTARAKISLCSRPDGIYELGKARLMAQMSIERDGHRPLKDGDGHAVFSQFIDISAPSVDELADIFFAFRDGSLSPVKNWSGDNASFTESQTASPSQ